MSPPVLHGIPRNQSFSSLVPKEASCTAKDLKCISPQRRRPLHRKPAHGSGALRCGAGSEPGRGARRAAHQAAFSSFPRPRLTSSYRVKLLVEATRVAYISAIGILSPERGLCGQAIGTKNTRASTPLKREKNTRSGVSHMITGVRPNQPRSFVFRLATVTV